MSVLAQQNFLQSQSETQNTESSLRQALQKFQNYALDQELFFEKVCEFLGQLTNAQNCAVIALNDSNELCHLSGLICDTLYQGLTIQQVISKINNESQSAVTLNNDNSRQTLRVISMTVTFNIYKKFFIVLESANETPLAAALAQERFELSTALFHQILTAQVAISDSDKTLLQIFLSPSPTKKKLAILTTFLTEKLEATSISIAPVYNHTVQQKLCSSSDDIADSLHKKIAIVMSEMLDDDLSSSSILNNTLAAQDLRRDYGEKLSTSKYISQEGHGYVLIAKDANNKLAFSDEQTLAQGFKTFYENRTLPRLKKLIDDLPFLSGFPQQFRTLALFIIPAVFLLIPTPYIAKGRATIVPTQQQVITAPITGKLESVSVEPGDYIHENDTLLATIDVTELMSEHDSLKAQYARHLTEWKIQRANGDAANARLEKLRADEISAEIELIQFKIDNSRIKSPISGYLQGDNQKQNIGIDLREGEELFRVVQKESTRVELNMPTNESLHFLDRQKPVSLRLDAYPGKKYQVKNIEYYPVAEFEDGENILRAVGSIDQMINKKDNRFMSGMQGNARIKMGYRPLIFSILDEPVRKLRVFLGI